MKYVYPLIPIFLIVLVVAVIFKAANLIESAPTPSDSNSNFSVSDIPDSDLCVITDKRTGIEYLFSFRGGFVKVEK